MVRVIRAAGNLLRREMTLRDGVIPRRPEWSATHQPPEGQPAAATRSVQGDGVMGVFRAARKEPTGGEGASPLALVPLDSRQHALGRSTDRMTRLDLRYPHTVDNGWLMCDGCHNGLESLVVLMVVEFWLAGRAAVNTLSRAIPSCPQSLSTAVGSTANKYQPDGRCPERSCINARN